MRVLVTGCGRSGTAYMAQVLQAAGLDVGHERMGRNGAVSWKWCPPDSDRPGFDVILHQVREPLATIASVTTFKRASWKYVARFIPVPPGKDKIKRAAYYWHGWNYEAMRQAAFSYRVEDLERRWPEICEALGIEVPWSTVAGIPRNVNHRKHETITWATVKKSAPVIYDSLRAAAWVFGYEEES